jgi:uncharacterized protein involved in exopolysaccharide biosynthesis
MKGSESATVGRTDEIDVVAVAGMLWRYRYLISVVTLLCALVAVYLALTATLIYRAEIVVTEARDAGAGGGGALASQFGGLASLVGLGGLPAGGLGREAQAVLSSRNLADEFIRRNDLASRLQRGPGSKDSLWFAVKRFREQILSIEQDKAKGTTTVSIEWTDPKTAAILANGFVALANDHMRARAVAEANRNIDYLKKQITLNNDVELQRVMYTLIEEQTKSLMIANGRLEYAFSVVDPAGAPDERIKPRRTLMVLIGLGLGCILGAGIAFVHSTWRRYKFG